MLMGLGGFGKLLKLRMLFGRRRDNRVGSWEGGEAHDGGCSAAKKAVPPARAPPKKGCMAVYVGGEMRRYVIPARYVSMPEFLPVMELVREVFGYDQPGGLCIPCDVDEFEKILRRMAALRK